MDRLEKATKDLPPVTMVTVATDAKRSRGALRLKKRLGPTSASDLAVRSSQPGTPWSAERNVAKRHRNSLSVSCEQIKKNSLLHLRKNLKSRSQFSKQ